MKFKIICPDKISGIKGETVTLYRNTKGLYVAILNGMEVGLVKEVETDTKDELPSCIDCKVYRTFINHDCFFAIRKEEDA